MCREMVSMQYLREHSWNFWVAFPRPAFVRLASGYTRALSFGPNTRKLTPLQPIDKPNVSTIAGRYRSDTTGTEATTYLTWSLPFRRIG
jgi:hypothetical protein